MMKTYYTRLWSNSKLVAMVKANTYTEALNKTVGDKWECMQKHKHDRWCEDPSGNKIPNYITFMYDNTMYYMYHF